jgi:hypothetical protein
MTDLDLTNPPRRRQGVPPAVVKWAPYVAGLVVAAAVVFFLIHRWQAVNPPAPPASTAAVKPVHVKPPTLDVAGRRVAGRFILTAVRRENLAEAWTLASPTLRAGITHAAWLKGNIPVVPYPAQIASAPLHIVSVEPRSALLEVALFPVAGSKARPLDFFLALVKVGHGAKAHWAVDSWVPRAAPAVPLRSGG